MNVTLHHAPEISAVTIAGVIIDHGINVKIRSFDQDEVNPCEGRCVFVFREPFPRIADELDRLLTQHSNSGAIICGLWPPQAARSNPKFVWITPARLQEQFIGERILGELLRQQMPTPRFGIWGSNKVINEAFEKIAIFAKAQDPVLITGERGTGKEVFSKALHDAATNNIGSTRQHAAQYVAFNCAGLNSQTIESELFGSRRGAFTDAIDRVGLLAASNGGSVLLDEVGELPLDFQAKLLRAVETKEVRPLGTNNIQKINGRLILATNRDLNACCKNGSFRSDFYDRIKYMHIQVPPLRRRMVDIPLLIHAFVAEFCRETKANMISSREVEDICYRHHWPGNVRELRGAIRAACYETLNQGKQTINPLAIQRIVELLKQDAPQAPDDPQTHHVSFGSRESWREVERKTWKAYAEAVARDALKKEDPWEIAGMSRAAWYDRTKRLSGDEAVNP